MKISPRYASLLFAILMSFFMALVMTGFVTLINTGINEGYLLRWGHSFILAWPVAMLCVLLFAPHVRTLVAKLTS